MSRAGEETAVTDDHKPTDTSVIPPGDYCYILDKDAPPPSEANGFRLAVKSCPYHIMLPGKPGHANGYCAFLGLGDWDEVDYSTKPEGVKRGTMLLWDSVKECGINQEDPL